MDKGLKDLIEELRDYGNARKGELAGMVLEAANRLEELDERVNTRSITISIDEKALKKLTDKAVQDAVEEIRQEMLCGDAISRQAALDCFTATKLKKFDFVLYAREEIKNLPPVIPKQRTGRWIMSDDGLYRPICDKCGAHPWKCYIPTVEDATESFKYCPKCGAKMEEVTGA